MLVNVIYIYVNAHRRVNIYAFMCVSLYATDNLHLSDALADYIIWDSGLSLYHCTIIYVRWRWL